LRKLEREMGCDPSGRTSDGVKWATLEKLCRGLGCTLGDLFSEPEKEKGQDR
jgi:DNA-binding Xre family transcriptional regulator